MKKIIAAAIVASALTGAVNAATFTDTYTVDFGTNPTDLDPSTNYGSFQLFDSTKGTLTGITVSLSYGLVSTLSITNSVGGLHPGVAKGYAYTNSGVLINSDNTDQQTFLSSYLPTLAVSGTVYCFGSSINYPSCVNPGISQGNTLNVASNGSGSETSTVYLASDPTNLASQFAAFEANGGGLGTVGALTGTSTTQNYSTGNVSSQQVSTAHPIFSISYIYDSAVPEPATWAMMLMGFGAIGYGMRRKGVSVAFN